MFTGLIEEVGALIGDSHRDGGRLGAWVPSSCARLWRWETRYRSRASARP